MKSDVELIAKAEAVLDRTLAYQAAQTVHELKATLGIDIQQINLAIRPVPNDAGTYRVVCTILSVGVPQPLELQRTVRAPGGGAGSNGGQASKNAQTGLRYRCDVESRSACPTRAVNGRRRVVASSCIWFAAWSL